MSVLSVYTEHNVRTAPCQAPLVHYSGTKNTATSPVSDGQPPMTQPTWTAVDTYFDPQLDAAMQASSAAGLPAYAVSPTQGKLLFLLAQMQGARNILELGTLGGYSTIWLARALPPGGKLVTLEASEKHAQVAQANIANAGLADRVELRVAPALDTLPQLAAEGRSPFDLIFIDADKENNPPY